jgi:hypothetical protein
MTPVSQKTITLLAERCREEEDALLQTLINASSYAEAGFALSFVRDTLPESTIVQALNMREVLLELPASPFPMRVDTPTLRESLKMETDRSALVLPGKGCRIEVLVEGNLCFDILLKYRRKTMFLKTNPPGDDIIPPAALKLILSKPETLDRLIELVEVMGLVFNPRMYFTIDDWLTEHTHDTMRDLWAFF